MKSGRGARVVAEDQVDSLTVIRVHGNRQVAAQALLREWRDQWNRYILNYPQAGHAIARVLKRSECRSTRAPVIVANDDHISADTLRGGRPPAVENGIDYSRRVNRDPDLKIILTRNRGSLLQAHSREDRRGGLCVQGQIDGCGLSAGSSEVVVADVNAVFTLVRAARDSCCLNPRLIGAALNGRGTRASVRLQLRHDS